MSAGRGARALAVLGRCVRAPLRVLLRARDLYVSQMASCAGARGPVGMVSVPRSRSHAFYRSAGGGDDADVRELVRAASRARRPGVAPRCQSMDIGKIDEDLPCEFGADVGGVTAQALGRRSRSCAVGSMGVSSTMRRPGAVAAAYGAVPMCVWYDSSARNLRSSADSELFFCESAVSELGAPIV